MSGIFSQAVKRLKDSLASSIGASLIGFIQAAIGAVLRTLQDKAAERVSVLDFGATGDGSDQYAAILAAWTHCLAHGKDLYFPAGSYSSGANNMPFKNPDFPATALLDCGNITIYGEGPATVLRSDSATGADVINAYSVKNLHFRNFAVTASISGATGSGSNGLSVVGGFDNVTFENIWLTDLPYVDKASYLDGGKALTIQPGTPTTECGTLKAKNIFAKGCVYGAGLEVDLANFAGKKHSIDIDLVAEDCYQGVVFSAGAATAAISAGATMGYRVRAQLVNCQRNVALGRAHGVDIEAQIVSTKTAAQKRLNPQGGAWNSVDSIVDALLCTYAKDSRLKIYGFIGECDYKAQIGGATAGSSGLSAASDNCSIYLDVGGTAATASILDVNSGGNFITNSVMNVSTTTAASIPANFYATAYGNTIALGPSARLPSIEINGPLKFSYTDGINSYSNIDRDTGGFALYVQQTGASSATQEVFGVKNNAGAKQFFVRNDGALALQGRATASAVATIKQVMPIYDSTNTLVGYVPIYTSFTP